MSPITTHVLDTARGRPAEGIAVVLELRHAGGTWTEVGRGATNADGPNTRNSSASSSVWSGG